MEIDLLQLGIFSLCSSSQWDKMLFAEVNKSSKYKWRIPAGTVRC